MRLNVYKKNNSFKALNFFLHLSAFIFNSEAKILDLFRGPTSYFMYLNLI